MAREQTTFIIKQDKKLYQKKPSIPIGQHIWERDHLKLEGTSHRKRRHKRAAIRRIARASRQTNRRAK